MISDEVAEQRQKMTSTTLLAKYSRPQ